MKKFFATFWPSILFSILLLLTNIVDIIGHYSSLPYPLAAIPPHLFVINATLLVLLIWSLLSAKWEAFRLMTWLKTINQLFHFNRMLKEIK